MDNFKGDFLNVLIFFFAPKISQPKCHILTNHTSMESLFILLSDDV